MLSVEEANKHGSYYEWLCAKRREYELDHADDIRDDEADMRAWEQVSQREAQDECRTI